MSAEGVDYAWQRPTISALVAAGKKFACRYGGPGSAGKQLDPAEAAALNTAGVSIVANAEGAADGLLGGRAAGRDWASRAETHFASCGMPAGRPIYLSVDFNVTSAQWLDVANALRGAGEILGPARVGVYGGLNAVRWARRDNVANWFWQTYAWSGGVWAAGNHIEQYRNGVSLGGATLDLDRAYPVDYGQWGVEDMGVWDEDVIPAPPDAIDYATNKTWQAKNALGNVLSVVRAMNTELDTVRAELAAIKAILAAGVPVPGVVEVSLTSVAAIADAVRPVVDEELDEQSRGGADVGT